MKKIFSLLKNKNRLFMQMVFVALTFALMAALTYFFTSGIVYNSLTRYAESVFSYARAQIEFDLTESENALGGFAHSARSLIMSGSDIETLRNLTYDMADYIHDQRAAAASVDDIVEDLFIYVEVFDEPIVISGLGWVFPDDHDPKTRLWYHAATEANGKIVTTSPFNSLRSGETVITFTQCIFDDEGNRLGIAGLNIQIGEIGKNIINVALDRGGYGMIISPEHTIIAHTNPEFLGLHISDPALPLMDFQESIIAGEDVNADVFTNWLGEETVIYLRKLPNGWHLGLLTPRGPFYQSLTHMMLILCALGTVLATTLIAILIRFDKAKDRADEGSRQKSAFLANMSHEIRTPLNAVIGLSELVLNTDDGLSQESRYRLEQINNAGETLLGTVNDILDISKIEAGKFELVPAKYDISSMINDAAAQSILHRGEKPIEFEMNISENLPTHLFGDELRIKQILSNLLSNAFKYTREGTVKLTVNSVKAGESIWLNFIVSDTGIGIKQEDMANLFNDYVQMDMEANRKVVGTGLGLSITKRLVDLMDGKIIVESEHGKGSTFTVRFVQKFETDATIGAKVVESLKNFHYSEQKRRLLGSMTRISLPYARVLIVDDVETNLDVARGLMKPYNMQIDCVSSGWESVEAMHNNSVRYNAIFMDHMMPGMDGVEATRLIREIGTDYAKNIPIIALTANAIVGNEEMFLQKGFQAFISKPIEIARLDAVIREWIRDKAQEKNFSAPKKNNSDEF
ncbi:MAG: ATP-binding protein, partial [Defluviitaleaceae bacterium]|nr:ATP-binding protein [Defluviitaleaceae bacterium]